MSAFKCIVLSRFSSCFFVVTQKLRHTRFKKMFPKNIIPVSQSYSIGERIRILLVHIT